MMNKLTKEEVLHVAHLARIEVSEEEIEKYQVQLRTLLDEVEKINDVVGYDDEFMITPIKDNAILRTDDSSEMISFDEVKHNVPNVRGNLIEVPVMIHE